MDRPASFVPLFQTEHGVVFRCTTCPHYHVAFGPIVLANDPAGLRTLCRLVEDLEPQKDRRFHLGARCYHLHTPSGEVGLVFSHEEVEQLRALLRGATAMLDLNDLLTDTLGPDARPST